LIERRARRRIASCDSEAATVEAATVEAATVEAATVRLFVAVWPPSQVVARVAVLDRPAQRGVRWTTADQWHVTLRFLGSVSDAEVEIVRASLTGQGPAAGTMAVAGPVVERLGRGVLCLPVAGLDELARRVRAATAGIGAHEADRQFRGHLTLARAKPGADLRALAGVPLSASWPVEEVTLVASETRPQGAAYRVLARAPAGSG
jgi:RNA 2',3'-cyclic 3'-phosphodiesterase